MMLSGCMSTGEGEAVSMFAMQKSPEKQAIARQKEAANSPIITDLQARRSVLPSGSPFAQVAGPVLEANSRAAESELKSARLRAAAANKNWLPQIGPNISLTSLSDIVAQIIVEQVLFDNGRKKAERAFAKADVEVAAVMLADDTNERVLTALGLYLDVAEARERVTLESRALKDMQQFEWIMNERVKGGVSDMSDLNVIRSKLSEINANLATQQEAAATALAELNAMSTTPLNMVSGLTNLEVGMAQATPLAVLLAEAEKERDIAAATMERAGLLPGLTAGGTLGDGGSGIGLNVSSDQLLGLGTGASLQAIEATKEAAGRRVSQAQEDSNRNLSRLESRAGALARQVGEAAKLTALAKGNLDLFQQQYDAGQRQVMDVVGVYETFAARQTAEVGLKYELALTRLELARALGLLADGSEI
ncbi:TolC family protein [Roseovarius faecimaris]|uniref:TolC family protein n=2 Tax=Roseovarius faecimaris TaxID=2494550 RepID=A0A6I6IY20_9RHOB|nr:TolC family protein [Roseovarius faecimaris]